MFDRELGCLAIKVQSKTQMPMQSVKKPISMISSGCISCGRQANIIIIRILMELHTKPMIIGNQRT